MKKTVSFIILINCLFFSGCKLDSVNQVEANSIATISVFCSKSSRDTVFSPVDNNLLKYQWFSINETCISGDQLSLISDKINSDTNGRRDENYILNKCYFFPEGLVYLLNDVKTSDSYEVHKFSLVSTKNHVIRSEMFLFPVGTQMTFLLGNNISAFRFLGKVMVNGSDRFIIITFQSDDVLLQMQI